MILNHHTALYEGSISRGTSAIFDSMDVALKQQWEDQNNGKLSLTVTKQRWDAMRTFNVTVDFHTSECEVTDKTEVDKQKETEDLTKLCQVIQGTPAFD